jgi:FKBP-type peptidyl-prolyl cis-trans isomerase FkpA
MSAKTNGTRIFIIVMVAAFLFSTFAFTGMVLWEMSKGSSQNKTAESTEDIQTKLQEQLDQQNQEGKLQGTKLEGFEPVASVSELQKIDTKEGDGEVAKEGATVTAHYTGAVAQTGIIFQSSHDTGQPVPFGLDQVIKGWTQGVPGMKEGGTRRLVIPADLAYGANPPQGSNIPPNAALVFDIELVSVENK